MSQSTDAIYNKSKQLKDNLILLFNNTNWGRYPWKNLSNMLEKETQYLGKHEETFSFWIPEDEFHDRESHAVQYNATFCTICGNYTITYTEIPQHIACDNDYCFGTFEEMRLKNETV